VQEAGEESGSGNASVSARENDRDPENAAETPVAPQDEEQGAGNHRHLPADQAPATPQS
jgi:hypothetical protein